MENITLYYSQGSSDKIYQANIQQKDSGYIVTFAFGRRGSTLTTGTKNSVAVDYDAAKAIYEKLVKEKMAKGYTPGEDGTPYHQTDKANATTGIHCQLLNSTDDVDKLINDPSWVMQEKFDGRRLLIDKSGDKITGINRLGLSVALPETLANDAKICEIDFIVDGEAIGDTLFAFDVLLVGNEEVGGLRYAERHLRLMNLLASFTHPSIHLVESHHTAAEKQATFDRMREDGCEGVVFKHIDAPYIAGRPASGGTQLKHKFCETASFIVASANAKRSVNLMLLDGSEFKPAGKVTIPPNHEIPSNGQIVECRYLYAFKESGCIYQPVYRGVRDDITTKECTVDQLKYKAA
jgi:bifunctional non-homologous end joining protein LigD